MPSRPTDARAASGPSRCATYSGERCGCTASEPTFARRRVLIERATDQLVFGPPLATSQARRLQKRYQAHRASLYVFLERDDVEPYNNRSERDLRNSVIRRKVTGGYRSDWGAEASAICTSILTTARKRGENLFTALRTLAGPSPLQAAGLAGCGDRTGAC